MRRDLKKRPAPRRWPWVLLALILTPLALHVYAGRPREGRRSEIGGLSARLRANPASKAAKAESQTALDELLAVTAAPDAVAWGQDWWLWGRAADSASPDKLAATAAEARDRATAMRRQAGFWREAISERPDPDGLARRCVYRVPYASCLVQSAGEVPGSDGKLRYQTVQRYVADQTGPNVAPMTENPGAAVLNDAMVGTVTQVFAPDPQGGWRIVLAYRADEGTQPLLANTPQGPILRGQSSADDSLLYEERGGLWRVLEQWQWKRDLVARAPRGACLAEALYVGTWPWPQSIMPELSRMPIDLPTLSYATVFRDGATPVEQVRAVLKRQDGALLLDHVDTTEVGTSGLLARLLGRCG